MDKSPAYEPVLYGGLLVAVLGSWAFVSLAEDVVDGETQTFDVKIVLAMRQPGNLAQPIGPPWMAEIGRDLTALGGYAVLLIVLFAVSGFLWLDGRRRLVAFVWISVSGGYITVMLLKAWFDRPRPDLVPHLSHVESSSFPSGHSMMSAVVYFTLGALLAEVVTSRRLKLYVLTAPLVLSLLVGMSRVYLGVHYPSDVLAGWAAGLVWATGCWMVTQFMSRETLFAPHTDREP